MAHRRGNLPDFEGGEIAQSIYLPRVGPRAGSPRSQEVDESRKSTSPGSRRVQEVEGPNLRFVRNQIVDCHLKVARNSNHPRPVPRPA